MSGWSFSRIGLWNDRRLVIRRLPPTPRETAAMRRDLVIAFLPQMRTRALVIIVSMLTAPLGCQQSRDLRLGATTSIDNSGLLQKLLEEFEQVSGTEIDAIAVGSGRALELVRSGDADLMLTHDPKGERLFIDERRPLLYRKLMCSDFVIAGPADDPARAGSAESAAEAMSAIGRSDSAFVSRGDDSGTHSAELRLWENVETRPAARRILESGQGMAATLRIASERNAYTLTDYATYLRLRDSLEIAVIYQGSDPELLNCYALTVPSGPRSDAAVALAEWLSRGGGRDVIASFQIDGERPFRIWPRDVPDDHPDSFPRP